MAETRITELLAPFLNGFRLGRDQLQMVGTYLDLLTKWNRKVNLTAVRDPEDMVRRHFGESLFAARHLLSRESSDLEAVDLGSGAGFPGLPLKIWAPELRLTLVESNQRKATFLREVIRTLGFTQAQVLGTRAEELVVAFDLVTLRAIERFGRMLPVAIRLLRRRGRIGLLISTSQLGSARAHKQMNWSDPLPIPLSRERVLLIGSA
jgi:16S rRNA (guanine527-N7)-methyltransferase